MSAGVHRAAVNSTVSDESWWDPEHHLIAAVLLDSFEVMDEPHGPSGLHHLVEVAWAFRTSRQRFGFGFRFICDQLRLDHSAVRQAILSRCAECSAEFVI